MNKFQDNMYSLIWIIRLEWLQWRIQEFQNQGHGTGAVRGVVIGVACIEATEAVASVKKKLKK